MKLFGVKAFFSEPFAAIGILGGIVDVVCAFFVKDKDYPSSVLADVVILDLTTDFPATEVVVSSPSKMKLKTGIYKSSFSLAACRCC